MKKISVPKIEITQFKQLYAYIKKNAPKNLNEQLIRDSHVHVFDHTHKWKKFDKRVPTNAGKRSPFQFDESKFVNNTRKCRRTNSRDIDPLVSCFPVPILLEIRDEYNKGIEMEMGDADSELKLGKEHRIDSNDPKYIITMLKRYLRVDTEDRFLELLDRTKYQLYLNKYFLPAKRATKIEGVGTCSHQYIESCRQYEERYPGYVNINYFINQDKSVYFIPQNDDFKFIFNEDYIPLFLEKIKKTQNVAYYGTFTHIYLVLILEFFLELEIKKVNQISISLAYNDHAQAIFINKTGNGYYIIYNSNGHDNPSKLDKSIDKDVSLLLNTFYPNRKTVYSGRHQYETQLCGVFSFNFIISMLDPGKSMEEKCKHIAKKENRDKMIIASQYDHLNKNMPYLHHDKTVHFKDSLP